MSKIKKEKRNKEIVIAVILVAAIFGLMWAIRPWREQEMAHVEEEPKVAEVRRALDGLLAPAGQEKPPLVALMVENMEEAQPLLGIADANLVFEALTEASVTRFLALYTLEDGREISEIGPIRSARPYFLDWTAEFDALYGHVGSSPAAYEMLRKRGVEGVHDLDQWYKSEYFFKKEGRPRPHHFYTSFELLRKAYGEAKVSPEFGAWKFKSDAPPDLRGTVSEIKIGYARPYNVQWLYDKSENIYKRVQWGGVHKDASGKEIVARNIAVAFEEMEVLDAIGRKKFTTIGAGKGLVFQDGRVVVGTWKKPSTRERMRWYDAEGNEVEFNAGVTWVEIVPKNYDIRY